jgi:hypothetical protein
VIWGKWKSRYFRKQRWTPGLPNGLSGKSDVEINDARGRMIEADIDKHAGGFAMAQN